MANVRIMIFTPIVSSNTGSSNANIYILLKSKIENTINTQSRIEKILNAKSLVEQSINLQSQI